MSEREPPAVNPAKPSFWSVTMVLFAALLIIPGLCAALVKFNTVVVVLLFAWIGVLGAWILALLIKFVKYLDRPRR